MMIQNLKQIPNVFVFISKDSDVALYGREWLRGNDVIIHMKCHGRNLFHFKPGFYQKMKLKSSKTYLSNKNEAEVKRG